MYLEASLGPRLSAETNQKVIRYVEMILEGQTSPSADFLGWPILPSEMPTKKLFEFSLN